MRSRMLLALPVLLFTPVPGCRAGERTDESPPPSIISIDAASALARADSVVLEQSAPATAGRFSGFDLDDSGTIALGDSSLGTVQLYDPAGRLQLTLGHKGPAAGEFSDPRFPRFRHDGTLHVADAANARVTVYSADRILVRTVQLRPLVSLSGFVPLEDGRYLATSDDPDGYVLFLFDSAGVLLDRFLSIHETRPAGQPASPDWKVVRQFSLAARDDSAFVTCTLSDSLWIVRLTDRSTRATLIAPPGYSAPTLPALNPTIGADLTAWGRSLDLVAGVDAADAGLVVNFLRGASTGGDHGTAVLLTPGARWIALENAPLLHSGRGHFSSLATVGDPGRRRLVLRLYRFAGS